MTLVGAGGWWPHPGLGGEVDIHFNNLLEWVGGIREPAVWNTLVKLRRLALQRELHKVASLLTNTLAQINMMRAAHVMKKQINDAMFGSGHPPETVVAMALAYHAFKTGRRPGDYGVTI